MDISLPASGLVLSQGSTWTQQRRLTLRLLKDFGVGKSPTQDVVSTEVYFYWIYYFFYKIVLLEALIRCKIPKRSIICNIS